LQELNFRKPPLMRPRNAYPGCSRSHDRLSAIMVGALLALACLALPSARGGEPGSEAEEQRTANEALGGEGGAATPDPDPEGVSLEAGAPYLPQAIGEDDFRDLSASSPFSRSLSLSDSLILTGVAVVDGEQVATLLNKETKETFVVSGRRNPQGWRMVEFSHDEDLEKVAAKVSVEGGEVVTVRYAEWQLKPGEARPGAGPGEGGTISARRSWAGPSSRRGEGGEGGERGERGGPRGGPSPEMRERLSQLSDEQRSTLFRRMGELRERNPEMSWEDRGRAMQRMADQLANQ